MKLSNTAIWLWIGMCLVACGAPENQDDYEGLVDLRDGPPNIVILALDTWRADHIGAYGNDWVLTPVLDSFASEAILFEDCSSTSTWGS